MQKRISLILSLLILFSANLYSQKVEFNEAKQVANAFYTAKTNITNPEVENFINFKIKDTEFISVFAYKSGGFVAVSLWQEAKPILAYSLHGNHDLINLPINVYAWFSANAHRINQLKNAKQIDPKARAEWETLKNNEWQVKSSKTIFLISSEWGQNCYYNSLCPADAYGPCGHCVTGCVATSMAMIMKYHNYPQFGKGSHSYISNNYGELSADFENTEYLWNEMPNVLTEENLALATLMYHCGVATNMNYTASSSGATVKPSNYTQFFKYSLNAEYVYQVNYTNEEWINLLKNEIDNNRPVQYVGFSDIMPEGHAWVCDGYDENDFLHFNWGYDNLGGFFELGMGMFPINNAAAIKIMPTAECDVIVKELISPVSQTFYEPVEIIVKVGNYSLEPINNISISYRINDESTVNEIITETIEPGQLFDYHFQQLADFTENIGTSYNLKIFSSLACDAYKFNDTLNIEIKNLACSETPFFMGFSTDESRDGWFVEDANNDGRTWEMTPQNSNYQSHTAYYSGSSIQADDWLFTKCIELNENKVYKLSFDYSSVGAYMFQNLEIYIGDKPNSQNMYQFLDSILNFSNLNLTTKEIYFTVNNVSYNYIGFRCTSLPDNLTLVLDNIKVEEMSQPDIAVVEISSPVVSCDMQNEKVKLKLRNLSSQNLSNFPISYQLNDENIVTEIFNYEILPNQIYEWEFEQEADLSDFGEYQIKAFTSLVNDFNTENDTLILEFTNYQSATSPYYLGFDSNEDLYGCVIEDVNNDNKIWKFYAQAGNEANGCIRYEYNDFKPADDWFFTSCLRLETNFDYALSFYHKIEANTWPENLKVKIGTVASSEAMNELLIDLPNLTNQTWQQSEALFTVSESGFYYIGFQCYSDIQMFNLYLDDIRLDSEYNSNSNLKSENLKFYPNPTNDIVNLVFFEKTKAILILYDTIGRVLFENKIESDNYLIDLNNYKSGVYFLEVFTEQGVNNYKIMKN